MTLGEKLRKFDAEHKKNDFWYGHLRENYVRWEIFVDHSNYDKDERDSWAPLVTNRNDIIKHGLLFAYLDMDDTKPIVEFQQADFDHILSANAIMVLTNVDYTELGKGFFYVPPYDYPGMNVPVLNFYDNVSKNLLDEIIERLEKLYKKKIKDTLLIKAGYNNANADVFASYDEYVAASHEVGKIFMDIIGVMKYLKNNPEEIRNIDVKKLVPNISSKTKLEMELVLRKILNNYDKKDSRFDRPLPQFEKMKYIVEYGDELNEIKNAAQRENDILFAIKDLRSNYFSLNKHGVTSKELDFDGIKKLYSLDMPILRVIMQEEFYFSKMKWYLKDNYTEPTLEDAKKYHSIATEKQKIRNNKWISKKTPEEKKNLKDTAAKYMKNRNANMSSEEKEELKAYTNSWAKERYQKMSPEEQKDFIASKKSWLKKMSPEEQIIYQRNMFTKWRYRKLLKEDPEKAAAYKLKYPDILKDL